MESWTRSWFQAHWAPSPSHGSNRVCLGGWPLRAHSFRCFGPENLTKKICPVPFLAASGLTEGKRVRLSPFFFGRPQRKGLLPGVSPVIQCRRLAVASRKKCGNLLELISTEGDTCRDHRKCCWYRWPPWLKRGQGVDSKHRMAPWFWMAIAGARAAQVQNQSLENLNSLPGPQTGPWISMNDV